jgi:hypothetical protein
MLPFINMPRRGGISQSPIHLGANKNIYINYIYIIRQNLTLVLGFLTLSVADFFTIQLISQAFFCLVTKNVKDDPI